MANINTSKAQSVRSRTKIRITAPGAQGGSNSVEDLGYFYDTIHGRVAFGELPVEFQPALKAALSSQTLDRLTRISQLGHTSLTYFSATQTRFSHAIGTLLMMNKLFAHLWPESKLPPMLLSAVSKHFPNTFDLCNDKVTCIRCHLLLAALYQDCGELPFQKVTNLYFQPHANEVDSLRDRLSTANPEVWKTKDVFTLRALCQDLEQSDLRNYDLNFLTFLITGDGSPPAALQIFRQMTDGTIDADRLDYVYRDALLTIGSLSRAETVLRSIVRYEPDHVVVDDPRPAVDFLSTRARLWTFVYASPDVRFRQTLLKAFLQAGFSTPEGIGIFGSAGFRAEVTLDEFLKLDDHSMLQRMRAVQDSPQFGRLLETGRNACDALLKTVTNYECRILPKPQQRADATPGPYLAHLPNDLFFDLLLDYEEEHKLYIPQSVRVKQPLIREFDSAREEVSLEDCCGALSPIFSKNNRAPLMRDSYFVFRPKDVAKSWDPVYEAIKHATLFEAIDREDVRRDIAAPNDTWQNRSYKGKKVAISCCFQDRPMIARIIRALQAAQHKYRVLLDSLLGLGNTSLDNSQQLIRNAEAVLVIASHAYIASAIDKPNGNIATEIQEIYARNARPPGIHVVVLAVDSYETLKAIPNWSWKKLHPKWVSGPPILKPPLRHAGKRVVDQAVAAAIRDLNQPIK